MIDRLIKLECNDFRCFNGTATFPLDAEVVLVHGLNGAGKTSLLQAIEFALTGRVVELSAFASDYPRCLKNIRAKKIASSTITFKSGDAIQSFTRESMNNAPKNTNSILSPEDIRFFRDRCYLSQGSLSRLLEHYQSSSKDSPEQPLVRFVRELLGLDLLENITAGLHDIGHISRIKNSIPSYSRLIDLAKKGVEQIQVATQVRQKLNGEWNDSIVALQNVMKEAGDPAPEEPLTIVGIKRRAETYNNPLQMNAILSSTQRFRHGEGQLQRIIGILESEAPKSSLEELQIRLEEVLARARELEQMIVPVINHATEVLTLLGYRTAVSGELASTVNALHRSICDVLQRRRSDEQENGTLFDKLSDLNLRATKLSMLLAQVDSPGQGSTVASRRIESVFSLILEFPESDRCPVCARDYSELAQGSLRAHILSELDSIGADVRRLEETARNRNLLISENDKLLSEISATNSRLKSNNDRLEFEKPYCVDLERLVERLSLLKIACLEWQQNQVSSASMAAEIASVSAQNAQSSLAIKQLETMINDFGITDIDGKLSPIKIAKSALEIIHNKAEVLEKRSVGSSRLYEALNSCIVVGDKLSQAEGSFQNNTNRLKMLNALEVKVDDHIDSAREIAKAATRAKTILLEQVFNRSLNGLWQELFKRLVKRQDFHPRLATPTAVRGHIRTTIEGLSECVDAFEQLASVASSGNLNTAALSLFLALHLIEQPRHKLLILDDPVQAMDDLHVVQLANLLKDIRRQAQRQIIIAVHERVLFDYLRLELGPTERDTSLITIELVASGVQGKLDIVTETYRWKPDPLQFP